LKYLCVTLSASWVYGVLPDRTGIRPFLAVTIEIFGDGGKYREIS